MKKLYVCMLVLSISLLMSLFNVQAQSWEPLGNNISLNGATYTSIAISSTNIPYVVYSDYGQSYKASVKKYNGNYWESVGVEGFSSGHATFTSIAIDGSGTPYVAYTNYDYPYNASVMKYNGSSWVTVGSTGISSGRVDFTDLAIDASGAPYIVYEDQTIGFKATVMKYNGSSWVAVGSTGISAADASWNSIAIFGGTPYIAYRDAGNNYKATVKKFNGSGWETVGNAAFSTGDAAYTDIAIDGSGTPYVIYRDGGNSLKATVKKYNGSSWVVVGSPGFSVGEVRYTSIAIDGNGTPYIAYEDIGNNSNVTVMKYDGSNWVAVGGIGFSNGSAAFTSIALNSSSIPFVAYSGVAGNATVFKYNPSSPCNNPTIINSQSTSSQTQCINGTFTAISVSASGTNLSYQWYKNTNANTSEGTVIGSNSNIYTPLASSEGTLYYYCIVSGNCGNPQTSNVSGEFIVNSATEISYQLTASQTQSINGNFTPISITANGTNLNYQWYSNTIGSNTGGISLGSDNGAQTNSYTPQTTTLGTLYYYCVLSGDCGIPQTSEVSGAFNVNCSPSITTPTSTATGSTTATLGGNITAIGCSDIIERGIYWSATNGFADGAGTKVLETPGPYSTGTFTILVTGLTPSTVYYFKAFATNSSGSSYSTQGTFTTATPTLTVGAITTFGNVCINTTSGPNTFTITGTDLLTDDITVAALSGFTYSIDNTTYSSSLTIPQTGGAFSQIVYVKFSPTAVQSYSGNIVVGGGGAASVNRSVTGAGINPALTITTPTSQGIGMTTATLGGNITATGCSPVTERGIYWSTTNGFADGAGTKVSVTPGPYSTGSFTIPVTGLTTSTVYYFKAFSTNSGGTVYTTQGTFTTFSANPTVTIGTATTTTANNPVYSAYAYNYTQQIYTASEISAGGGVAGMQITTIRFYWAGSGNLTNTNSWVVYLCNTATATFASTTSWVPLASLTSCYDGAVALPGAAGWMTITLTTPYIWDGTNLVVAIDENVAGVGTAASWRYTSTSANYRTLYHYNNTTNPNPASPPTATSRTYNRPNIQLVMQPQPPCSATPTPGNTLSTANPLCNGQSITLSLQNATTGLGVSYQWQSSTDGIAYSNISDATSSIYTVVPDAPLYYQCIVTCLNGPTSATSTPIHITFNNNITSTTPGSRCGIGTVSLSAIGSGGTLNWYTAATGGVPLPVSGSPWTTPIINATTTYYVAAETGVQVNATIGTSTTNQNTTQTYPAPYGNWDENGKHHILILGSELSAAGLSAGNLSSLKFDVASLGTSGVHKAFTISIANTPLNILTATLQTTGFTTVFGPVNYQPIAGLNTHTFSNPFYWDGSSNIIVEVCFTNDATSSGIFYTANAVMNRTTTAFNSVAYLVADNSAQCPLSTSATISTARPNMIFAGQSVCSNPRSAVTATVNTAPTLSATANPTTICQGTSSTLTATSSNPDYTYTWSPTTTPSSGAVVTASPIATTVYTVSANDYTGGPYGGCASTATVSVVVNPIPTNVTATASMPTVCVGGSFNLNSSSNAGSLVNYSEGFETWPPANWTFINAGLGNQWASNTSNYHSGTKSMSLTFNLNNAANCWGITQGFNLNAGITYTISFWYVLPFGTSYPENLKVTVGNAPTVAAQTTILWTGAGIVNTSWLQANPTFTPMTTSMYYFAWNCYSAANMHTLVVDDISITGGELNPCSFSWTSSPTGFTSSEQNPTNVSQIVNTEYTVTAQNDYGCVATASTTVAAVLEASIITQPAPAIKCLGQTATFIVAASGPNLIYTWQKNTIPIDPIANPSAATASLTLNNVTALDAGDYSVVMSADCGLPVTSDAAALTVKPVPTISASSNSPICAGSTLNLIGTNDIGSTFSWTGPDGFTSSSLSPTIPAATIAASGTYSISAILDGCVSLVSSISVVVNQTPSAITVTPSSATVCPGGNTQLLTASGGTISGVTILSETFNGGTNNWTKLNNSTNGTPALAAWTLEPDAYVYTTYGTWHSNDNSKFYMSNSDVQGTGGTTATILQSPSISTVGFTQVNISFWHYFYEPTTASSTGKVEVSLSGTTWTSLQTYNSTQGAVSDFVNANIALTAPFLNQSIVYIRFKYDGVWRFFWGIDNVSITGIGPAQTTWSPQTGLFTNVGATLPYIGSSTTTVYALPVANTTYTVTSTATSTGCASSNTVSVAVNAVTSIGSQSTEGQTQCIHGTFTPISVTASGIGTLTYQWYKNTVASTSGGTAVGANSNTYTPSTTVAGTLFYYCMVTGSCGTATSTVSGAFVVNPATTITSQSTATQTQYINGTFTSISIAANGSGTLSYQWFSNTSANTSGGIVIGTNSNTYTPLATTIGTLYYYCVVHSDCGADVTSAISGAFFVNPPPPTITYFTPASGAIGSSVTITGTNFNTTVAQNIVFFGATQAMVTEATSTSLTVTVPVGVTYQYISVTNLALNLTAYSASPFIVTLAGNIAFAKEQFSTGGYDPSVSIGDIDGDGKSDLVVANYGNNMIWVFRNMSISGNLSFAYNVNFTTGSGPSSVSIGDLDGDGKPDLAVAINNSSKVSVYLNTSTPGSISFATNVDFTTGSLPETINIGDLNGDGKPDLVVANTGSNTVSVLCNTSSLGTISFATKIDFTTGSVPFSASIGDIDGDGKPDLAVNNYSSNTVSVFRNTSTLGAISLSAKVDFTTGIGPGTLRIGDIDGDGKPDLAVPNISSNTLSVLRNTSSSGSVSFASKVDFTTGSTPYTVCIGDIDGDGKPDLAVPNSGSNTVSILRNTSTSGSVSFASKADFTTGTYPYSVCIGDIDGDGKPDLTVADRFSSTVSVLKQCTIYISSQSTATQTQCINGTFTPISVTASGTGTLTYQWYKNTVASNSGGISLGSDNGAQTESYTPEATTEGTLYYYCGVTGSCGTVVSEVSGAFIVNPVTSITNQSTASHSYCVGETCSAISVIATGTNLSYQWYSNTIESNSGGTSLDYENGAQTNSYTPQAIDIGTLYYYCVVTGDCGSPQTSLISGAFVVNSTPDAPTGSSPQSFCSGNSPKVADLVVSGSNIKWYSTPFGQSTCSGTFPLYSGSNYYATQTVAGCESSTRLTVAATVNITPDAPTGIAAQTFCSGATVANLAATGTTIQWYAYESGGSALATSTVLVHGTRYYASQTLYSCESSDRLGVTATVNTTAAPTGTAAQSFCSTASPTVASLAAIGTDVKWYDASSAGNLLVGSSALVSGTHYYASQTVDGCESSNLLDVTATIHTPSTVPTSINGTAVICNGTSTMLSVADGSLGAGASWHWYETNCGGALVAIGPSATLSPSSSRTYYIRAENACNTTACANVDITVNEISVAPTSFGGTTTICAGEHTTLSIVGGSLGTDASWHWYSGSCGGTFVETGATIDVNPAVNTTYYVRAEGTCNTSSCASATVTVNTLSIAPISISGTASVWIGVPTTLTVVGGSLGTGASYKWYFGACGEIGVFVDVGTSINVNPVTNTTYYVRAEGSCNTSDCSPEKAIDPPLNHPPTLNYTNNIGFVNHVVSPANGTPNDEYRFEVRYTDADGDLPAATYPRLKLDFDGNPATSDANDRLYFMMEIDPLDVDVSNGKDYYYIASSLPESNQWKTSITAVDDGNFSVVLGPEAEPDVLTAADVSIFANDITFSNSHPNPGDHITVSAVIHNYSGSPANNFEVRLVNQFAPDVVILPDPKPIAQIAAYSSTTVSWDIQTPDQPAWCPMQVIIDCNNALVEPNELDNQAIRPFINGNFVLPGHIEITATATPPVAYSNSTINVCGSAWYVGTSVVLLDPSCAGATVTYTVVETGQTGSTYSNSLGNYCFGIYAPFPVGIYHVNVHITDFTLDGDVSTSFEIIAPPPCLLPDLVATIDLGTQTVTPGNCHGNNCINILQGQALAGSVTVTNQGLGASLASELHIQSPDGNPNPSGNYPIPALAPGASFNIIIPAMTFINLGGTYFSTTVDFDSEIDECSEGNNNNSVCIMVHPTLPDIIASGNLGSPYYECQFNSITFWLDNQGGVATGPVGGNFACSLDITPLGGAVIHLPNVLVNNIPALTCTSVTFPWNQHHDPGNYSFEFHADCLPPLPLGGVVAEISELNNAVTVTTTLIACKPDLTVYGCSNLIVNPVDPIVGGPPAGDIIISATVANIGLEDSGPFDVEFMVDGNPTISNQLGLLIGQSRQIQITVPTPAFGNKVLTVTIDPVDPQGDIDESNEFNNVATASLCWDFYLTDLCGNGAFWNYTQIKNTPVTLDVGVNNLGIYKASNLDVHFYVRGPKVGGIYPAWGALPDATAQTFCGTTVCSCPFRLEGAPQYAFQSNGTYQVKMIADPHNAYIECDDFNNELIVEVLVSDKPEYRVLSQYIAPSLLNPDLNVPIDIDITYENIGMSSTQDIKLFTQVDNTPLEEQIVPGLMQGTFNTIHLVTPWSSNIRGIHIIRTFIDHDNQISENDELNNEATRAVIVGKAPNLVFIAHSVSNSLPPDGAQISIDATIQNIGYEICDATYRVYYLDNQGNEVLVGQQFISLDVDESIPISIPWTVVDTRTTLIGRISDGNPMEYNITDNEFSLDIGANLNLAFTTTPALCHSSADGVATVTVSSGGQAPYSYLWSNGYNVNSIAAVAGSYSVTVTDVDGLTSSGNVIITAPAALVVGVSISTPFTSVCQNDNITFTATPTNGGLAPMYNWYVGGVPQSEHSASFQYNGASESVYCIMTSNAACVSGIQETSNTINLTVNPIPSPPSGTTPQTLIPTSKISDISVTGTDIKWYNASTGGDLLLSSDVLIDGTTYYASQTINGCESSRLAITVIIPSCINPSITSQSTTTQTKCFGESFTAISIAATGTNLVYHWFSKADQITSGGNVVGANSNSYTPSATTVGTLYYYCVVHGDCGNDVTSQISGAFTVNPATTINSQSTASQAQCFNGSFTPIIVMASGTGTITYQWYKNTVASNNGGTSLGSANGAQTNSYIPSTATVGTLYYYCVVHSSCGSDVTSAISGAFTVSSASIGGSISGSSPITYGGSTGTLTLSSYVGSILNWEKKLNSGNWTTIANTSATYSEYPTAAGSWSYRAVVKNDGCVSVYSNVFCLIVNPKPLSITADDKFKNYDGTVYTGYTVSYSGFVLGDTYTSLGGSLTFSGTAITATSLGFYTITPSGQTSSNYAITYNNGTLEIFVCNPTYTVTNTLNNGIGSLRYAINHVCNNGTINFDPSIDNQIITLTTVPLNIDNTITFNNSNHTYGISISGSMNNIVINAGHTLTLASGSKVSVLGSIVNNAGVSGIVIASGASFIQNTTNLPATAKRVLSNAWHLFGSPFQQSMGATLSNINTGVGTVQLKPYTNGTNWLANVTSPLYFLQPTVGYAVCPSTTVTASLSGNLFNGLAAPCDYSIPLTYNGTAATQSWNLLANPFPSYLYWNALGKTNLSTSLYYWNPAVIGPPVTNTSYFSVYNSANGVGVPASTKPYIAPLQGFFVRAIYTNPKITLPLSARTHSTSTFYKESNNTEILVRLKTETEMGMDEMVICKNPDAKLTYEDYDSEKMFDGLPVGMFSLAASGEKLVINTINDINTIIPLTIMGNAGDKAKITAFDLESSLPVYLEDRLKGKITNLSENSSYSFEFLADEVNGRFFIRFNNSNAPLTASNFNVFETSQKLNIIAQTGEEIQEVEVFTLTGACVFKATPNSSNVFSATLNLSSAIYLVKVKTSLATKNVKVSWE